MLTFNFIKIEDLKKELGSLIKKMRKANSLTQEGLAENLNLSRLTIQKVESGKNFNFDTLLLIFQHFNQLESFYSFLKEKSSEYNKPDSLY
ncbi:helix-turn-helix transcriptional regulator [Algoriphagus yeomjeoni]|uniref:Helix-turn-helix protein n=1 Tax=Algoriphagus yeomjeoni TaxID=291403 RepID=A0A327P715_9BACT|nr:helix-turn-helix domain-containing protein [Algoriphagus yeomjeoni]RAI86712.1 helix-turn-helix protein [Algoriphagus yeomjeoni]